MVSPESSKAAEIANAKRTVRLMLVFWFFVLRSCQENSARQRVTSEKASSCNSASCQNGMPSTATVFVVLIAEEIRPYIQQDTVDCKAAYKYQALVPCGPQSRHCVLAG